MDEWVGVLFKEIAIGLLLGTALGLLAFGLGVWRGGADHGLSIGLVVLLTMVAMLLLTNLLGVTLPFVLERLGLDPAMASGPLITSVADALGLVVYFAIAAAVLSF